MYGPISMVSSKGLILGLRVAKERRRYKVTPSLIGVGAELESALPANTVYWRYSENYLFLRNFFLVWWFVRCCAEKMHERFSASAV